MDVRNPLSATQRVVRAIACVCACLAAAQALADTVPATVQWHQRAELGVAVSGVVASVGVSPGDRVEKGQVLLALDPRAFAAKVERARARLARIDPDLAEAGRELERAQDMFDRTLLSEHDLEVARIGLARLTADRAAARAGVTLARLDLERSVLRAPFDGVVIDRRVGVGEAVIVASASVPLIALGGTGELVARAHLKLTALQKVQVGARADVLVNGATLAGKVVRVSAEPVSASGQPVEYAVDVLFAPSVEAAPRIGQPVQVKLP